MKNLKKMKLVTKVVLLICLPMFVVAQYNHQFIHENLSGDELLNTLRTEYTATNVLTYSEARDILFSEIRSESDSLSGIYTDMTLYLDPTQDPTQAVFLNGVDNGINTEHCYPRSKGAADGNGKSDMHHLFPSRVATNSDRGHLPFGDIADNQTKRWYYKKNESTSIPDENKIDLYSEWIDTKFEPRESVKGDIARAMFYFFTIYKNKALAADPSFFAIQRADLCQWHVLDPIDSTEWTRTMKISTYQDDIPNPFILDCSLALRSYCPEIEEICYPSSVHNQDFKRSIVLGQNFPNPYINETTIPIKFSNPGLVKISIRDMFNQEIALIHKGNVNAEYMEYFITIDLSSGLYWYEVEFMDLSGNKETYTKKMVKVNQ